QLVEALGERRSHERGEGVAQVAASGLCTTRLGDGPGERIEGRVDRVAQPAIEEDERDRAEQDQEPAQRRRVPEREPCTQAPRSQRHGLAVRPETPSRVEGGSEGVAYGGSGGRHAAAFALLIKSHSRRPFRPETESRVAGDAARSPRHAPCGSTWARSR